MRTAPRVEGGRANRPGPRRHVRVLTLAAAAAAVAATVSACGGHSSYGGLPSYLRTVPNSADATVTASPGAPKLSVQGEPVSIELASGASALATASGPVVPPFVAPPPPTVTATFTVTVAKVEGSVPIRLQDFTLRDQEAGLIHPQYVRGEVTPPSTAKPSGLTTFQVTAVLPTGEGILQWAPGGGKVLVAWDFTVEDD
jgi:hypothetical protein